MKRITIRYSEDFGKNQIALQVCEIFRKNNLKPSDISLNYNIESGAVEAEYNFTSKQKLPEKSGLTKLLEHLNLSEISIIDNPMLEAREYSRNQQLINLQLNQFKRRTFG